MEENVKVPFWQKTWVVVLACIFIQMNILNFMLETKIKFIDIPSLR